MEYIEQSMNRARNTNCKGDTIFLQALKEVLVSIQPLIEKHPEYLNQNDKEQHYEQCGGDTCLEAVFAEHFGLPRFGGEGADAPA